MAVIQMFVLGSVVDEGKRKRVQKGVGGSGREWVVERKDWFGVYRGNM